MEYDVHFELLGGLCPSPSKGQMVSSLELIHKKNGKIILLTSVLDFSQRLKPKCKSRKVGGWVRTSRISCGTLSLLSSPEVIIVAT